MWKRSKSARHSTKMDILDVKTQQLCETSSTFDSLAPQLLPPYHCVLRFHLFIRQKNCVCHEKVHPRHTKCCTCHEKWACKKQISRSQNCRQFHKLSIWSFKHHPPRWDVTAPATQNATFRTLLNKSLTPANVLGNAIKPSRLAHFSRDAEFLAPATRNAIWTSKNIPNLSVFSILTSKCASRHSHVQF